MAFVLADRVKESCSSPGTGTVTLLGAATGYQSFSAGIGANNTTYYTIADQGGANWEVGYGTIGAGGTTLARTTVLASSNSGSLVNFSSGSQDVFCDYTATKAVYVNNSNVIPGATFAASTSVTTPIVQATNSAGLALKNSAGTTQMSMGAGGGDNLAINVATNINGANAQIDISPTGTGHVHMKPSGTGSIEIAPTNVGTIDNMTIGATTPKNASVVDLSVTGTTSFDGSQGTAGQVLTSAGTGATPTWANVAATTPAGSNTEVQYNNSGAFGASSSFTYASSTLTAPIVSASNGLVVNSNTVSASYTIPSGSSASSVGPMTVASGQSVTVPSGSRWVVL